MRNRKWIPAGLALALALLLLAQPARPFFGALLLIAQTTKLVVEAEKRYSQLSDTLDQVEATKERIEGAVSSVGNMVQQLGADWRSLYARSTGLVSSTLSLPADLRSGGGDLWDSLQATTGSAEPLAEWRSYTGAPATVSALAAALGADGTDPADPVTKSLAGSLAALQRAEALGAGVRQASRNLAAATKTAKAANDKQREQAKLETASQTALLQKLVAAQLTANELLAALAQVEGLSAAAGTLEAEQASRSRNEFAAEAAASKAALDAELARQAALRQPDWAQNGANRLFSLAWSVPGGTP